MTSTTKFINYTFFFFFSAGVTLCLIYYAIKSTVDIYYEKGYQRGASDQLIYIKTFPNEGFMSYGFRDYVLKEKPNTENIEDMKVAYAKYKGIYNATAKDTTGLKSKIDSIDKRFNDSIEVVIAEKWKLMEEYPDSAFKLSQ